MTRRQIVITGVGVVSPIGIGCEPFWTSLSAGQSGVGPITQFDASELPVRIGAEVRGFDAREYVTPRKSIKLMCRDVQLSYVAARLASSDAQLAPGAYLPERLGVVFGADMMYCELPELVDSFRVCIRNGVYQRGQWGAAAEHDLFPLWMLKYLPNMPACHIGISHDARGPNNSITQGEVSSLLAMAEGAKVIERDQADVMIVGGGSSRLHPTPLMYRSADRVSHRNDNPAAASRPFDHDRDGLVNGEGAAAFVLESEHHARRRGATILARVLGSVDCYEPRPNGRPLSGDAIRRALAGVLRAAEIEPADVGHLNAHGLSTRNEDPIEARAIRDTLGSVPVTAPKSFFGNLGAGTGAVEMAASVLGLQHRQTPQTLNYDSPDTQCPINVVHHGQQPLTKPAVLVTNFTTTGQAAAIALSQPNFHIRDTKP